MVDLNGFEPVTKGARTIGKANELAYVYVNNCEGRCVTAYLYATDRLADEMREEFGDSCEIMLNRKTCELLVYHGTCLRMLHGHSSAHRVRINSAKVGQAVKEAYPLVTKLYYNHRWEDVSGERVLVLTPTNYFE